MTERYTRRGMLKRSALGAGIAAGAGATGGTGTAGAQATALTEIDAEVLTWEVIVDQTESPTAIAEFDGTELTEGFEVSAVIYDDKTWDTASSSSYINVPEATEPLEFIDGDALFDGIDFDQEVQEDSTVSELADVVVDSIETLDFDQTQAGGVRTLTSELIDLLTMDFGSYDTEGLLDELEDFLLNPDQETFLDLVEIAEEDVWPEEEFNTVGDILNFIGFEDFEEVEDLLSGLNLADNMIVDGLEVEIDVPNAEGQYDPNRAITFWPTEMNITVSLGDDIELISFSVSIDPDEQPRDIELTTGESGGEVGEATNVLGSEDLPDTEFTFVDNEFIAGLESFDFNEWVRGKNFASFMKTLLDFIEGQIDEDEATISAMISLIETIFENIGINLDEDTEIFDLIYELADILDADIDDVTLGDVRNEIPLEERLEDINISELLAAADVDGRINDAFGDNPGDHILRGEVEATIDDPDALEGLAVPPPITEDFDPPRDPDGDDRHQNVRGTNESTILDVQALFDNLDRNTVQDYPWAYNFSNASPDDTVMIYDVAVLWRDHVRDA